MVERILETIESTYQKFLLKKISEDRLCKDLGTELTAFPFTDSSKTFTVSIANRNGSDQFFGMRIFPKIEYLNQFCKTLASGNDHQPVKYSDIIKRWKTIPEWVLEIDYTCFDRTRLNLTPKELVALTLHEIGHVIYSDKPVESFYRAYQEVKTRMKIADRATEKMMYGIYMIPLSIACMQRRWLNSKNEIHLEIIADRSVMDYGYGTYLTEALEKIIKAYGTQNTAESQQNAEVATSVQWCGRNMTDVVTRKERLKDELYYQAIKAKSNYFKAITIIILDKLGANMRERYTGAVVENATFFEECLTPDWSSKYVPTIDPIKSAQFNHNLQALIATESFGPFGKKKVRVELPSQFELDQISVEIDKISNHHDRIFVLDLIYEVLERINTFEEVISADPMLVKKWSGKIQTMKAELEGYRQATLKKNVFNNGNGGYKFLVRLPAVAADYEG